MEIQPYAEKQPAAIKLLLDWNEELHHQLYATAQVDNSQATVPNDGHIFKKTKIKVLELLSDKSTFKKLPIPLLNLTIRDKQSSEACESKINTFLAKHSAV